ncbi:germ cell-less protein-like 1 isoform X2 [Asterias rubens]|uniref:germ cell-less protein-like 1 isoform X2 n=1 Tax=Asterias rubens TaxID=7604 RepID=UPI0014554118|nr:germ cell-less protein-like 1 isoform X2 [Asterias rubens]
MGGYVSTGRFFGGGKASPKKRKRGRDDDSDDDSEEDEMMRTPQRKKLKSTSKYIYDTLFVNGENSDITIFALGKEWYLHKIYLCQSSYFASMFSGSWKESNLNEIVMNIPDNTIDIGALEVALGSLYRDDVMLEPAKVVPILAAASLLQLDGLICQCADIMTDTISTKTVCCYHTSASAYGLEAVTNNCVTWLEQNLMDMQRSSLLRELSLELFEQVIRSPDLFVLQVEMDVYSMVKKFVFLKLVPSWNGNFKNLSKDADVFFRSYKPGTFLQTERGQKFESLFQGVRLQHIINDLSASKHIEKDHIMHKEWLLPVYQLQWQTMLCLEQGQSQGPTEETVSPEVFDQQSLRCGRVIARETDYCWRWTGYNYGMDVLFTFANRLLIFRRNTITHPVVASVSLQNSRNIMFRVRVVSYDGQGHVMYLKKSDLKVLKLNKDEEAVVLTVDRHAPFPMRISVNMLCATPPGKEESVEGLPNAPDGPNIREEEL